LNKQKVLLIYYFRTPKRKSKSTARIAKKCWNSWWSMSRS